MGGHGWGETNEREFAEAVSAAIDGGINFFDTADVYGLGASEEILGRSLGKERRQSAIIATKFGVRREKQQTYYDNSPKWMSAALEGSLRRLKTDYIDLYQLHYWDGITPPDDIIEALQRLREQGKIRYFGVTNVDLMSWPVKAWPEGLVSFSAEYSLARRESEADIIATAKSLALTFLSWGSLGQGVLSGKYNENFKFPDNDRRGREAYINFHGEKLVRNLAIVDELNRIRGGYDGKTVAQLALRWILDRLPFGVALTGIKRRDQLIDSLGALGWALRDQDISKLNVISAQRSNEG